MRLMSKILIVLGVFVLAGCAAQQPVVEPPTITDTVYVYPDCGKPPPRKPVDFAPVSWQVIDGRFTLSAEGYKRLAYDMAEILRGVEELKLEIQYYIACVEPRV